MLDDRERAMLLDIENHLLAEDPGWSTAFSTCARWARVGSARSSATTTLSRCWSPRP